MSFLSSPKIIVIQFINLIYFYYKLYEVCSLSVTLLIFRLSSKDIVMRVVALNLPPETTLVEKVHALNF